MDNLWIWLVVEPTSLKNMKVSWDDDIPNTWENKKCSKPPTSNNRRSPKSLIFIGLVTLEKKPSFWGYPHHGKPLFTRRNADFTAKHSDLTSRNVDLSKENVDFYPGNTECYQQKKRSRNWDYIRIEREFTGFKSKQNKETIRNIYIISLSGFSMSGCKIVTLGSYNHHLMLRTDFPVYELWRLWQLPSFLNAMTWLYNTYHIIYLYICIKYYTIQDLLKTRWCLVTAQVDTS